MAEPNAIYIEQCHLLFAFPQNSNLETSNERHENDHFVVVGSHCNKMITCVFVYLLKDIK